MRALVALAALATAALPAPVCEALKNKEVVDALCSKARCGAATGCANVYAKAKPLGFVETGTCLQVTGRVVVADGVLVLSSLCRR